MAFSDLTLHLTGQQCSKPFTEFRCSVFRRLIVIGIGYRTRSGQGREAKLALVYPGRKVAVRSSEVQSRLAKYSSHLRRLLADKSSANADRGLLLSVGRQYIGQLTFRRARGRTSTSPYRDREVQTYFRHSSRRLSCVSFLYRAGVPGDNWLSVRRQISTVNVRSISGNNATIADP